MKKSILLILVISISNNAMDNSTRSSEKLPVLEVHDSIGLVLPNKKLINVGFSNNTTLKMLKEFINKNHSDALQCTIEKQAIYPIQPHPKAPTLLIASEKAIPNDKLLVSTAILSYQTRFFMVGALQEKNPTTDNKK